MDLRTLTAAGLHRGVGRALRAAQVGVGASEFSSDDALQWSGSGATLSDLDWTVASGLTVDLATAGSVQVNTGSGAGWTVREGELQHLAWSVEDILSARGGRAAELKWRLPDGSRWRFAGATARALTGDRFGMLGSEMVHFGALEFSATGGETLQAGPMDATGFGWTATTGLQLDKLRGEQVLFALADARWKSAALSSIDLAWTAEAGLQAEFLSLQSVQHTGPGIGEFSTESLDVTRFGWDPQRGTVAETFTMSDLSGAPEDELRWRVAGVEGHGLSLNEDQTLRLERLSATALRLDATRLDRSLSLGAVYVQGAEYARGTGLGWSRLVVTQLEHRAAGEAHGPRLRIEKLASESARFASAVAIDFGDLRLSGLSSIVRRATDGQWIWPIESFTAGEMGDIGMRIDSMRIVDDSTLMVIDESVEPALTRQFESLRFEMTAYDTTVPGSVAAFTLRARTSKLSEVQVAGELRPTHSGTDWSATGEFTGIDLQDLSSHFRKGMGLGIGSGRGDMSFELTIADGQLDADTTVVLSNFATTREVPVAGDEEASSLPIETTLLLLKDKQGTIRLNVPISGTLSDPSFNFSNAYGRALAETARTVLTLAFQPFGIIASARGLLTKLTDLQLKPLLFEPGRDLPNAVALTYLDTLGEPW